MWDEHASTQQNSIAPPINEFGSSGASKRAGCDQGTFYRLNGRAAVDGPLCRGFSIGPHDPAQSLTQPRENAMRGDIRARNSVPSKTNARNDEAPMGRFLGKSSIARSCESRRVVSGRPYSASPPAQVDLRANSGAGSGEHQSDAKGRPHRFVKWPHRFSKWRTYDASRQT